MAPGDHRDGGAEVEGRSSVPGADLSSAEDSHWVRWHQFYEDPGSPLSLRLQIVQSMVRDALDRMPAPRRDPIRIVSLCAGQGRDVIDVVAAHPRRAEVSALLVELDPGLAAFARARATQSGVAGQVQVVVGDASLCHWYEDHLPADLVLVCGVFGNITTADIRHTILTLPGFCRSGSEVIWTRHRRPPDLTPTIRSAFAASGFEEVAFETPDGYFLSVGRHRLVGTAGSPGDGGRAGAFDARAKLFDFVGDGHLPA
jgi:ubiquinone/menaquinone biosynthesis C-methylase UbiE